MSVLTTLIPRNVCGCNSAPRSKHEFPVLFNFMTSSMKRSVDLRLQFLTGFDLLKGVICDEDHTPSLISRRLHVVIKVACFLWLSDVRFSCCWLSPVVVT